MEIATSSLDSKRLHHQYLKLDHVGKSVHLSVTDVMPPNWNAYSGSEATTFTITAYSGNKSLMPN